jgi:hypothetical protein
MNERQNHAKHSTSKNVQAIIFLLKEKKLDFIHFDKTMLPLLFQQGFKYLSFKMQSWSKS